MSTRTPIKPPRRRTSRPLRGPIRRRDERQPDVKTWLEETGIEWPDVESDDIMPFELEPQAPGGDTPVKRRRPGATAMQQVLAHHRVRTVTFWLAVLGAVGVVFGIALGTITLNNMVIERSVELGKLDEARRTFRTRNAILSADIAKLSAPPRILRRARKRLKMQPSPEMAQFIYLDPSNNPRTRKRQQAESAKQAKVANAVARGTRIVNGEIFLRPSGVSATPHKLGEDGVPRALPGDGAAAPVANDTSAGTPDETGGASPPEGSAG